MCKHPHLAQHTFIHYYIFFFRFESGVIPISIFRWLPRILPQTKWKEKKKTHDKRKGDTKMLSVLRTQTMPLFLSLCTIHLTNPSYIIFFCFVNFWLPPFKIDKWKTVRLIKKHQTRATLKSTWSVFYFYFFFCSV